MTRLIARYRKLPSISNRALLQTYLNKHMMAICCATDEEREFLAANDFR